LLFNGYLPLHRVYSAAYKIKLRIWGVLGTYCYCRVKPAVQGYSCMNVNKVYLQITELIEMCNTIVYWPGQHRCIIIKNVCCFFYSGNNLFISGRKFCWEILPLGGPEVFYVLTYKWSENGMRKLDNWGTHKLDVDLTRLSATSLPYKPRWLGIHRNWIE